MQKMTSHSETAEPIPPNVLQKMKSNKYILSSIFYKRQILLMMFDLKIHSVQKLEDVDVKKIYFDTEKEVLGENSIVQMCNFTGFWHLAGKYDSSYYGYCFSEISAANIFQNVFQNGEKLDQSDALFYREKFLDRGSTLDGTQMLSELFGGEICVDNWIRNMGYSV